MICYKCCSVRMLYCVQTCRLYTSGLCEKKKKNRVWKTKKFINRRSDEYFSFSIRQCELKKLYYFIFHLNLVFVFYSLV